VFLESAFFWPDAIMGRARRYNFTSDASHRFERGVDFANNVDGIERATRLIVDICGGEPGPTQDVVERLPQRKPVRMRVARAQKVIGMPVAAEEMQKSFQRLALPAKREGEAFVVEPPSHRYDLAIEEDLIEEVARLYGYERIRAQPPRVAARALPAPQGRRSLHELRERLAAADYHEVINFGFGEPQWEMDFAGDANPVRLLNPIASPLSVMRSTLIGSLVSNLRYNQARKLERIRVFELGRVFLRDPRAEDGPLAVRGLRQPIRIGALAYGTVAEEQWAEKARPVDFYDAKADLEALIAPLEARYERAEHPALHPGRSAKVHVGGAHVGWIGELHPRWLQKYELARSVVVFELDAEPLQAVPLPVFTAPSKYPPVVRDMALVVDAGVPAQALLDAMEAEKPAIVASIRPFDLYQGPGVPLGRKSLAFRVVMQHTERTLTDAEADAARDALVSVLARNFSASLRK
jgi:phenylalanyl-tRNA synthetase beta chain